MSIMKIITMFLFLLSTNCFSQATNEELFNNAVTEMQNENYQAALNLYNKFILKNPNNCEALEYRAFTKLRMKKYSEALIDINKSIKINNSCSGCYETRAEIKYRLNDLKGCVSDYEKAFELEPILANSDNYYQVAKSKLVTKTKSISNFFIPNINLIENILSSNSNFTNFYNQFYDNIESYTDEKYLNYNEKTNEHDIPQYQADVITTYKGAKVFFTLKSRTENEPIYDVTISSNCVCEWFSNWNKISLLGFKEYKRYDSSGIIEIWGIKGNLEVKYSFNSKSKEKSISIWKK